MSEWWVMMALIGGSLGVLIILAWLCDWALKEGVRELRDIWHENDEPIRRYRRRR